MFFHSCLVICSRTVVHVLGYDIAVLGRGPRQLHVSKTQIWLLRGPNTGPIWKQNSDDIFIDQLLCKNMKCITVFPYTLVISLYEFRIKVIKLIFYRYTYITIPNLQRKPTSFCWLPEIEYKCIYIEPVRIGTVNPHWACFFALWLYFHIGIWWTILIIFYTIGSQLMIYST